MDSSNDSVGIDVPESLRRHKKEEPIYAERYAHRRRSGKGCLRWRFRIDRGESADASVSCAGSFSTCSLCSARQVVMEACGPPIPEVAALRASHRVLLLPPHQVRPYVRRNKTARTDVKGIL